MQVARPRARVAVAAAGLLVPLLAACGSSVATPQTLTLYNGQHVQTTDALVAAFRARTGIAVQVRSADEDALAEQIATEGPRSPADLVFTENTPPLFYLEGRGLLARLPAAITDRVPARDSSPTRRFVGVTARVSVMVYNPRLIARRALPSSILDLAAPRFAGRIALAPGETDFQPLVSAVDRSVGARRTVAWLRRLRVNAAGHIYGDNETVTAEVSRGAVALGVINQYYWYRLRAESGGRIGSRLAEFRPRDPGYLLDVSGIAVLASSTHRAAAERFIAFVLSAAGQRIIARSQSYEYPLAKGAPAIAGEPPLSTLKPDALPLEALGDGTGALALLEQAGLL